MKKTIATRRKSRITKAAKSVVAKLAPNVTFSLADVLSALSHRAPGEHPHFTKLDSNLKPLPRSASQHAAVYDVRTGMVHDVNFKNLPSQSKAVEHAGTIVIGGIQFRAPTADENDSIRDRSRSRPAIDTEFFPNTPSDWFWSSTAYVPDPVDFAWGVYFSYGHSGYGLRGGNGFVRAVFGPVARPGQ